MFSNTYTPSLARQCLAVGLYPFRNGYKGFHTDLEPGAPTFTRWFAEHGYYTACCGKLHHRGPDLMQGWLQRIGSETAVRLRHFCAIGAEEFCPAPLSSKRRPRRGPQSAGQGLPRRQMPAPLNLPLLAALSLREGRLFGFSCQGVGRLIKASLPFGSIYGATLVAMSLPGLLPLAPTAATRNHQRETGSRLDV